MDEEIIEEELQPEVEVTEVEEEVQPEVDEGEVPAIEGEVEEPTQVEEPNALEMENAELRDKLLAQELQQYKEDYQPFSAPTFEDERLPQGIRDIMQADPDIFEGVKAYLEVFTKDYVKHQADSQSYNNNRQSLRQKQWGTITDKFVQSKGLPKDFFNSDDFNSFVKKNTEVVQGLINQLGETPSLLNQVYSLYQVQANDSKVQAVNKAKAKASNSQTQHQNTRASGGKKGTVAAPKKLSGFAKQMAEQERRAGIQHV